MARSEGIDKSHAEHREVHQKGDKQLLSSNEIRQHQKYDKELADKHTSEASKKLVDSKHLPDSSIKRDFSKALSDSPAKAPEIDEKGRVKQINYPDGKTRAFEYDEKTGDLLKYKDKNGHEWKWDRGNPTRWERTDGKDVLLGRMIVEKDGSFKFVNLQKNYVSHYDADGEEKVAGQRDLSSYSSEHKMLLKKQANEFASTGKPQETAPLDYSKLTTAERDSLEMGESIRAIEKLGDQINQAMDPSNIPFLSKEAKDGLKNVTDFTSSFANTIVQDAIGISKFFYNPSDLLVAATENATERLLGGTNGPLARIAGVGASLIAGTGHLISGLELAEAKALNYWNKTSGHQKALDFTKGVNTFLHQNASEWGNTSARVAEVAVPLAGPVTGAMRGAMRGAAGGTAFDALKAVRSGVADKAVKSVHGEVLPNELKQGVASSNRDVLSKLIDHSRSRTKIEGANELKKGAASPNRDSLSKLIDHSPNRTKMEIAKNAQSKTDDWMSKADPTPFNPTTGSKRAAEQAEVVLQKEAPSPKTFDWTKKPDPTPRNPFTGEKVIPGQSAQGLEKKAVDPIKEIAEPKISAPSKKVLEIKDKGGQVVFEGEFESIKAAVQQAIKERRNLIGVDLSGLDLSGVVFKGINLAEANLKGAILRGANFRGANLYYTVFDNADLTSALLEDCVMHGTSLKNAVLDGASLERSYLGGARLQDATLRNSNLKGARLENASLVNADLSGSNLRGACVDGADLSRSNMSGTNLKNVDFRNVKKLEDSNLEWDQLDQNIHRFDDLNVDWRPHESLPEDYYTY